MPGYDLSKFSPSLVRTLTQHGLERGEWNAPVTRGSGTAPKSGPRSKRRYVLVRVDEKTGAPIDGHLATDADTEELSALLTVDDVPDCPALSLETEDSGEDSECETPTRSRSVDSRPSTPAMQAPKPGGPCDHCGANESPQWRRGPPTKPMLCNACGTRYRRTNQLGPPVPSTRCMPQGGKASPASSSGNSGHKKRGLAGTAKSALMGKKARCGSGLERENSRATTGIAF